MKKYLLYTFLLLAVACAEADEKTPPGNEKETPAASEGTTKHPNGVSSGAVISTDTSAMKQDSTIKH